MSKNSSADAFVFFGATGDLAYKKIFPALAALIRKGRFDLPIIGVAKADWSVEQLRERARSSLAEYGGGVDDAVFARLVELLRYVDGDYRDPTTFHELRHMRVANPVPRPTASSGAKVALDPGRKPPSRRTAHCYDLLLASRLDDDADRL